jgi:phosphonate transport system substrate-binding protein
MKNSPFFISLSCFFITLYLGFFAPLILAKETLYIGVFPRFNVEQIRTRFTPIAKYLEEHLQQPVELLTSKDFESFNWIVKSKKLDIVHFNQYHYLKAHKQQGYEVILSNEEFGKATISGVLVVRKDSNITSISQLKDKRIVFGGGPSAMISSIVPRQLLHKQGLNHDDYQAIYAQNPPNALIACYTGDADAAGLGDSILKMDMLEQFVDLKQLKILAQSPPLQHLPWAVKGNMNAQLKTKIQSILATMGSTEKGKKILKNAYISGLMPSSDADYEIHREIIANEFGEFY